MREANIGLDDLARHVHSVNLGGAAGRVGVYFFRNLSLKISASSVRAEMVTSPTWVDGTYGWGFGKASIISLAAMINISVEDNCGIR
jgi:hypothetical protein